MRDRSDRHSDVKTTSTKALTDCDSLLELKDDADADAVIESSSESSDRGRSAIWRAFSRPLDKG
jgi:hypothetical protein